MENKYEIKYERMEILEQIADITTDLLFCNDENEQQFCEELLCRKLSLFGYVDINDMNCYVATSKSKFLKEFREKNKYGKKL